jgi:23S rRNA (cytosine1962-C5)-methyltransferase
VVADDWSWVRRLLATRVREGSFYRALHGISQLGLPRYHLDRYGSVWVVTFSAPPEPGDLLSGLGSLLSKSAAGVVFRHREGRDRSVAHVVEGTCPEQLVIEHAGYRFEARPLDPIDPGAYPDSEPIRDSVRAESAGKRVLNLFAFTCLNGVVARLAGARSVVNVDLARNHLVRGKRNHELNGLSCDDRDFVAEDVLRFCGRARPGSFDLVVVDPPPLVRRGRLRVESEELVGEMLGRVLPLVAPGGTVHFLQCTARISAAELEERVRAACPGLPLVVHAPERPDLDANELPPTFKDVELGPL